MDVKKMSDGHTNWNCFSCGMQYRTNSITVDETQCLDEILIEQTKRLNKATCVIIETLFQVCSIDSAMQSTISATCDFQY